MTTNRIVYPSPNRLGLIKPTPWIETIMGHVIDNGPKGKYSKLFLTLR